MDHRDDPAIDSIGRNGDGSQAQAQAHPAVALEDIDPGCGGCTHWLALDFNPADEPE
jgi:hypothetical protein